MERIGLTTLIGLAVLGSAAQSAAGGLAIESASVVGARIHLIVRNDGEATSRPLAIALTTRAGGFMVGTASHPIPVLVAGARHEIELPLPVWAPDRPDLLTVITQRGCCTTRAVLLPSEVAVEVTHRLPLPIPARPPGAAREASP